MEELYGNLLAFGYLASCYYSIIDERTFLLMYHICVYIYMQIYMIGARNIVGLVTVPKICEVFVLLCLLYLVSS